MAQRLEVVAASASSAKEVAEAAKVVADSNVAIVRELAIVAGEDESTRRKHLDRLEGLLLANNRRLEALERAQREEIIPNVNRRRATDNKSGPWPGTEE